MIPHPGVLWTEIGRCGRRTLADLPALHELIALAAPES